MATKLFLRNTSTNGITDAAIASLIYDMVTTAGAASDTTVTNTTAGGTEIQLTKTAGGSTVAWVSGRAPAGGFTLTATDISAWQHESNMNANIGGRFRVYKYSGGVLTELGAGPFDDGVEMAVGTPREDTWAGNVTDTAFAENDRIVLKAFLTNVGTMASGHTGTTTFDAADAATGDSFFNIAETVTFKVDSVTQTFSGSDTPSLTEAFTKEVQTPKAETVSLTEAFTKMTGIVRGDTVSFTEGFSAIILKLSSVADTLGVSESLTFIKNANAAVADTVALAESFVKSVAVTTSDTLGLTEGFSAVRTFLSNLGDTLGITEVFTKGIQKQHAETVGLTENLSATVALSASASDTMSLGEALQTSVIPVAGANSFDAYCVRTCTTMPRMVLPQ